MYYGYTRASTEQQHLDRGIKEIEDFCKKEKIPLEKIFAEKETGKNFQRPRYTVLKEDVLRKGDVLIITEVDRLGRNKKEILDELRFFKEKHIRIMILEIPTTLMDISTLGNELAELIIETVNNILIEIYAAGAQAEMEKRVKRQAEGIAAKKARGEWEDYGRPRVMKIDDFEKEYQEVLKGKVRPFELMKKLHMKESTYYRYKREVEKNLLDRNIK